MSPSTSDVFSAFSGQTSAFKPSSASSKSFSELLKEEEAKDEKDKKPVSAFPPVKSAFSISTTSPVQDKGKQPSKEDSFSSVSASSSFIKIEQKLRIG